MKLTRLILMLTIVGFTCNLSYGQGNLRFLKTQEYQDYKTVWFVLDHKATETEYKAIWTSMTEMDGIVEFIIEDGVTCKLSFKYNLTADEVHAVLQSHGFDFKYDAVEIVNFENIEVDQDIEYPEHYPVKQNTGDPVQDQKAFERALIDWKKTYPEEYKEFSVKINSK